MGATRLIYIGGYTPDTGGTGPGITTARRETGGRLAVSASAGASGPSFLALHPRLPMLYAVAERDDGRVTAYTRHADGTLALSGERPSGGSLPCHVAVDPQGSWLAVANYGDGTLAMQRLDEFGRLAGAPRPFPHSGSGPDPERQEGPHAHQATFGSDGVLYLTDLGTDEIRRYLVGDEITPHPAGPVRVRPGTGPRHLAAAPGRRYLTGELDGTVTAYDDAWNEVARVPASGSGEQTYPSHIELSADGRHLHVANRGPDTVAVLDARTLDRVAEVPAGGVWPRHFAVVGDRMYVACQRSDGVAVLALRAGIPEPPAEVLPVGTPSCVLPAAEPQGHAARR